MRIASYIPEELTVAEADRYWLSPLETCRLAAIGDIDKQPEVRLFVNNVSNRGHVPYEKPGAGRTSRRLYSFVSAIMLRTIKEIIASGRTYEFAAPIAEHVADLTRDLIQRLNHVDMLDKPEPDWLVVYSAGSKPKNIRTVDSDELKSSLFRGWNYDFGVFLAGDIILGTLRAYPDFWAKDLIRRGIIKEEPVAIGLDGWPINDK